MIYTRKVEMAREIIEDTLNNYKRVAVACSFGKDSMVVLDLALLVDSDVPVFFIKTPFKPKETIAYQKWMTNEWHINLTIYENKPLIYNDDVTGCRDKNVEQCCEYFKVEPTKRAVKNLDAWITGLRNTEGRTREDYRHIEEKGGLMKVNPILNFTELDVWRYLAINHILVNPLYAKGYRSLGCIDCSMPEKDEDELEREGRWQGTKKQGLECGIHTHRLK